MRKNKASGGSSGGGDWSDTGTFVRKPATGWLHKDSDLANGAYVKYRLSYLGCAGILESMRSLQYQVRTTVTREGITRLAEHSEKIPTKKRKMPKQVTKILGETNARWANEVNLCIDVEQLQICSVASGREIMTHSLTSISFASGGDGITQDFIGYVAKDPINDRACHVFYCPGGTAQLVLASLGQAFELRYKMYLGSSGVPQQKAAAPSSSSQLVTQSSFNSGPPQSFPPPPQSFPPPLPEPRGTESFSNSRFHGNSDPPPYGSLKEARPQPIITSNQSKKKLPSEPPPLTEVVRQIHQPLPPPPSMPPQPLPPQSMPRPRVYSSLPGFPDPEPDEPQYEMRDTFDDEDPPPRPQVGDRDDVPRDVNARTSRPLSYNPYDTMPEGSTLPSNQFIGQIREDDDDDADNKENDYDSVDEEEEVTYDVAEAYEDSTGKVIPPHDQQDFPDPDQTANDNQPPAESDYQLITIHQKPSIDIEDEIDLTPVQTPDINHVYSNLQEELGAAMPHHKVEADYDDPDSLEMSSVGQQPTKAGEYDDPDAFLQASIDLNSPDCPPPPYSGLEVSTRRNPVAKNPSPAFDDSIYSTPQSEYSEPEEISPYAPIHLQTYFHGRIPRADAEFLVKNDGDFLVRESTNKPGQYVLTGLSNGKSQHLLLIDRSGKVKSRDREFESVPHLVKFFYDRATSLTIGNCEVFLTRPITVQH